ncbi:NAD(P)H-binding protein [Paenibacillus lignilyticus]|uniref:NAD(P)H-binding protein n=1 Tax=Paenibacillus lignilyticus TaxID=1172615 RepID=A0ABS5CN52_9BACL|nr:NAD(P)H-binding protein [Paenibacillus lignilyticus]MBP3967284.1 NAD(P)H-binding protein [Paenibacillus lignilyticus]
MEASATYKALLVGATGLVGASLLRQLLQDSRCSAVTILVRRPLLPSGDEIGSNRKLTVITADLDRTDEALAGVEADIVFCTLGTTIKKAKTQEAFRQVDLAYPVALGDWAERHGAAKMIIVSAMGANASSSIFYNRVKGEMEAQLSALGIRELHIVRPSLLLGKREEFRLGEKFAILLTPLLKLIMQGGLRKYRPVEADDVAAFMVGLGRRPAAVTGQEAGSFVKIYENDAIQAKIQL